MKDGGSVTEVVFASINLNWIGKLAATAARREGTSMLLVDGSGTLMAASADEGEIVGRNFADNALVRQMLAKDEGTMTVAGLDGVRRIFSYVRVPWTQARLAVGLDERVVHSRVDRELRIAYLQLALVAMLVLLTAWFGGERLIWRGGLNRSTQHLLLRGQRSIIG